MDIASLEESINQVQLALNSLSGDDPDYAAQLTKLGAYFEARYQKIGNMEDLDQAIDSGNLAAEASTIDNPSYPNYLRNYGWWLGVRFEACNTTEDLLHAIGITKTAVEAMPEDHLDRAASMNDIAIWLETASRVTGETDYIYQAVRFSRLAVAATPHDHPDHVPFLDTLTHCLKAQYNMLELLEDLDQVIEAIKRTLQIIPLDHPDRAEYLNDLGVWFCQRFKRTRLIEDIRRAIELGESLVDATHTDGTKHSNWGLYLENLVNWLGFLYEKTQTLEDLNQAITATKRLVDLNPGNDVSLLSWLLYLVDWLEDRFLITKDVQDLDQAIEYGRLAVGNSTDHLDIKPVIEFSTADMESGHDKERLWCIYYLIKAYWRRFLVLKAVDDLDQGIALARLVLDALPPEHEDRHKYLCSLSDLLGGRFSSRGDAKDLDERIKTFSIVLDAIPRPHDHQDGFSISSNLAVILHLRFSMKGDLDDIDRAIAVYVKLTDSLPRTHPSLAPSLQKMANSFERKFDHTGDTKDLDEAVKTSSLAVRVANEHDQRLECLHHLGRHLYTRFERTGSMDDLERAISLANEAIDGASLASVDRADYQNSLAAYLRARYERTDNMDDLEYGIATASQALEALPGDDPRLSAPQTTLANLLSLRYQRTENMEDLDKGVELLNAAVESNPVDHTGRAKVLSALGNILGVRFRRLGQIKDLLGSIEVSKTALTALQGSNIVKAVILNSLAINIRELFGQTGKIEDLHEAIQFNHLSLEATPDGDITKPLKLNNLAISLITRFGRTGDIHDLNEAVTLVEHAQQLTPVNHPNHITWLITLSEALSKRFERTREYKDLDQAVNYAKMVVEELRGRPNWLSQMQNFAHRLGLRFEYSGDINDLHQAIDVSSKGMEAMPIDHAHRPRALYQLSIRLGNRFDRLGDIEDLNKAIELVQQTVEVVSSDHIDRANCLTSLAQLLRIRFERTGELENINRAIQIARMAVDAIPADHPEHSRRLNSLGTILGGLFERTKDIKVLNESIHALATAVDAINISTALRAGFQMSLGNRLQQRYEFLRQEIDLNNAIQLYETAIENTAAGHETRRGALNNLASILIHQFEKNGEHEILDRASEVACMAAEETPRDHPDKAIYLYTLGLILARQYGTTSASGDFDRCVQAFKDVLECNNARPMVRLHSAEWLGAMFAKTHVWESSALFFRKSLDLIPMISHLSLPNSDKQYLLTGFGGLSSMAAAVALNAGSSAMEALGLLELGRGVIASLVLDMRADLSDLQVKLPDLASQFISLRDTLDVPEATSGPAAPTESALWEQRSKERREKEQQFHDICDLIRSKDGFEGFLRPPTSDQMLAAADLGSIIVINVSQVRSDAFIITPNGVTTIHLSKLRLYQAQDISQKLQSPHLYGNHVVTWILEWAWDVVAKPCLEALGIYGPPVDGNIARIWWILTGPLSHLPIHAAGRHAMGLNETVMDRAMSSYSSSVKALIRGRQQKAQVNEGKVSLTALLVAMKTTPDQNALPFALDEIMMLEKLCRQINLQPVHARQKCKEHVLNALKTCTVFHFAGHGKSHGSDPSRSCLLLDDWQTNPLCVADLRDNWLGGHAPFLAYLSACSTGSNKHDKLADEAVHLVSACRLAGFRHVIGTFWAVSDRHCVDVARTFYEMLQKEGMTDLAVCRGLHDAICQLRGVDIQAREARAAKKDVRQRREERANPFLSHGSSTQRNDCCDKGPGMGETLNLWRMENHWYTREFLSQPLFSPRTKELDDGPDTMLEVYDHERDATFWDSDGEDEPTLSPLLWAPYFHFGV